jgi:hypothetical protein
MGNKQRIITLEKIILRMKEHAAEMLEPAKINLHFGEDGMLKILS